MADLRKKYATAPEASKEDQVETSSDLVKEQKMPLKYNYVYRH
jgi:hypothetical protein